MLQTCSQCLQIAKNPIVPRVTGSPWADPFEKCCVAPHVVEIFVFLLGKYLRFFYSSFEKIDTPKRCTKSAVIGNLRSINRSWVIGLFKQLGRFVVRAL